MRLLEFNHADNGAGKEQSAHMAAQPVDLSGMPANQVHQVRKTAHGERSANRVIPIKGKAIRTPAQTGPIDLEKLQQRVELLEKRIKLRTEKGQAAIPGEELEQLRQRLLKLERNINSELWAARQREHTMLELLAKPSLDQRILQFASRILTHYLPAIGRGLKSGTSEWLRDRLPEWWPTLARAWQEALDKARESLR